MPILVSPGVDVSIIDQSQYLPAAQNSVPFVLIATAQDKANPSGTVAVATTAANADKLFLVTSQRDLVNLYGKPFFYTTAAGTPIQGYELNEYGLLAAYSLLGTTNRCYVLRADIDLASLVGQTGRPSGNPTNGTFWLDTTDSTWGIYEWNLSTGKFTNKVPIVITDSVNVSGDLPLTSIGNIGDYAVIAIPTYGLPTGVSSYFYKNTSNQWVELGLPEWQKSWPTAQGTIANPLLTASDQFTINMGGVASVTITLPGSPDIQDVVNEINNLGWGYLQASAPNGKLLIYLSNQAQNYITLAEATGTPLADMGVTPGTYYRPAMVYGTSAQMPLWSSSQAQPRPSGSVWIKTSVTGNGANLVTSEYNSLTDTFVAKTTNLYLSDAVAIASLDATGGQAIPAGTTYAQYSFDSECNHAPIYLWQRLATGATVVTGTNTSPSFTNGPYTFDVYVSTPNSSTIAGPYALTLADNSNATDFVTAWSAGNVPYTSATVTTDGAIQLSHTTGGVIIIDEWVNGSTQGLCLEAGFVAGTTTGVKYGPYYQPTYSGVSQTTTSGGGSGATFSVISSYTQFVLVGDGVDNAGGSGYAIGDTITIDGTDLGGVTGTNDLTVVVTAIGGGGAATAVTYVTGFGVDTPTTQLSNWVEFDYTANEGAPNTDPANGTNWFYSVTNQVDIMVQKGGAWLGYRNTAYDTNGAPAASGSNTTDPNGPIVSASEPTTQSDGTALTFGDLWIDTSDLENYPVIYRWQSTTAVPAGEFVLIDNTDQVDSTGIVFADARWATNGTTDPVNDPIPTIKSLLTSNYLDLDAPDPTLYPEGMLLFNTRRSGYNVKQFSVNYFNADNFPDSSLPTETNAWVSASGLQSNGAPYMGRKAQRNMVVIAMRQAIGTNMAIREEDNYFNLIATPNYPELQPQMITLNNDRAQTAYIVGDTPMRLADQATQIQAWATNAAGASSTGEDGLVSRDKYMGLFYPSGLTSDLDGNLVAVPASHMMLRTFLRNDQIAYPWFAAAGTRRGTIDNATNIGYLDSTTGEFVVIKNRLGIRDVLYVNGINPLVFFTGVGLLNYGNKSSKATQSALDRTNVGRLINYIRFQLTVLARPFVFEPNDSLTRTQISGVVESLMLDLVAKRGLRDYSVVCDDSNNTPARIDANELWIDIAVEPVKAVEFIYIPVRIVNTGAA